MSFNPYPKKEHSVKVPRLYKVAASILRRHKNGEGSIKSLVYESQKKHPNVKALFALVAESLRREAQITEALRKAKVTENEPRLDADLAAILVTELMQRQSLPGESKYV